MVTASRTQGEVYDRRVLRLVDGARSMLERWAELA